MANDNPHTADLNLDPRSIIEKLVQERREREDAEARAIENEQEWRDAANKLFASPYGKLFIKYLLRQCGLFRVDTTRDMTKMLEDRGAKNVYLRLIRPYLTAELLMELETQK